MIGKCGRPTSSGWRWRSGRALRAAAREIIWARMRSTASASKRGSVEREPQQVERLVLVLASACAAMPRTWSRLGAKLQLDRLVLQPLLERLGVEIAGAFVEQSRPSCRRAPALSAGSCEEPPRKAKFERDQRHGRLAHQPGLDAAGADDALDLGGARQVRKPPPATARQQRRPSGAADSMAECALITSVCPSRPCCP